MAWAYSAAVVIKIKGRRAGTLRQVCLLAEDLEQTDAEAGTPLDGTHSDASADDGGSDADHRDLGGTDAVFNRAEIDHGGRLSVHRGGSDESRARSEQGAAVFLEDRDARAGDVDGITDDGHGWIFQSFTPCQISDLKNDTAQPNAQPRLNAQQRYPKKQPTRNGMSDMELTGFTWGVSCAFRYPRRARFPHLRESVKPRVRRRRRDGHRP